MTVVLLFAGMVVGMVSANILLKLGATAAGGVRILPGLPALNGYVMASMAAFATAFGFYFYILRVIPLNVAQSFAAVQFVAIIFAANVFLGEPIGALRWSGIALIALGIFCIGLSTKN